MESVLSGLEDADVYINNIGVFYHDWDHHVKLFATILRRLRENEFTINPLKCEWAVQETDWLGYWLTPRGLKPRKKKIEAILYMDRPRNATELCMFIGCVNYYQDMWPSCAHILKPLTDQTRLKKCASIKWTDEMQQAIDKMRALMAPTLSRPIETIISGLIYTQMCQTSSWGLASYRKEGRLPTSLENCRNHSKITQ
jgi:hypothetical protein